MQVIADLQLHSRFSRAVSKAMTLPVIAQWARRKGIGLVATGDWTHPMWFREIERDLEEVGNGLLKLKASSEQRESSIGNLASALDTRYSTLDTRHSLLDSRHSMPDTPLFLLATEVSCIYSQGGRVRRVHTLIWVPSMLSARKISQEMTKRGCNLMSDGRPIVGLTSIQIAELVFSIEPKALIIPAHAWTPWFSVYGSLGGFDSIEEAFGPYANQIYAIETGLSSNPSMNWRIKELDNRAIVSFSDAHSAPKLGREATVFEVRGQSSDISYQHIYDAIAATSLKTDDRKLKAKIAYTIEFYPEEGKYHFTGHRTCHIRQTPEETRKQGTTCPVCGKPLTVGVMHRVDDLAARSESDTGLIEAISLNPRIQAKMFGSTVFPKRPPFLMVVPLQEIISEAIGSPVTSPRVQSPYMRLTNEVGTEFAVLLESDISAIAKVAGSRVAEGIERVRLGQLVIDPGYDGVFGVVKIWQHDAIGIVDSSKEQLSLLSNTGLTFKKPAW